MSRSHVASRASRVGSVHVLLDAAGGEQLYRIDVGGRRLGLLLQAGRRWYWKPGFRDQWRRGPGRQAAIKAMVAHAVRSTGSR